jgi:hypothetical protein
MFPFLKVEKELSCMGKAVPIDKVDYKAKWVEYVLAFLFTWR